MPGVTGRSVHDALLRVLTSAALRARLRDGTAGEPPSGLGAGEAAVLKAADPDRLRRLARFMGRHFYRERIVRLFAGARALARRRGQDPLDVLDGDAFGALLERAEVGSVETADRVASLVEARLRGALAGLDYAGDLVAYEGMLFRVEAGPRRWTGDGTADGIPVRAAHTRVCTLDWDVTGLVAAVRRGDAALPEPTREPTRLLLTLAPSGRVTAARCPGAVERLLAALDGRRSAADAAAAAGIDAADGARVLRQLAEVGAVEWTG